MNEDQVKGTATDLKGKAKETWGKVTNNPDTQAEGVADQVEGKVQKGYGDAKEAVKDAVKK